MAGELPHYSAWVRRQHCRTCFGPGPCEPHHAHCGTTYDPDHPPPVKSAGPKRGRGQRTHDKWLMPMHHRCHGQFTDHTGHFRGWNDEQRDDWERRQVAETRRLYAAEFPDQAEAMLAIPDGRAAAPAARPRDAARARVRSHFGLGVAEKTQPRSGPAIQ